MSDIVYDLKYTGTKADMMARLKQAEQKAHQSYPQYEGQWSVSWRDDGGTANAKLMGMNIVGDFTVIEKDSSGGVVKITIKLPMMLAMMKGPIETMLKSEMQKMLA